MKTSETTGKLAAAEAAAQAELGVAIMDKKNPHFKSEYLSHKGAVEVILPTYSKHGISISQCFRMEGDVLMLDTRFTDKSGEWRESEYPVAKYPERPQVIAANGTYAKRLSLVAMACLAADADDDGNEANKTVVHAPQADISAIIGSIDKFCNSAEQVDEWWRKNKDAVYKLSKSQMEEVIAACTKKKAELKNEAAE